MKSAAEASSKEESDLLSNRHSSISNNHFNPHLARKFPGHFMNLLLRKAEHSISNTNKASICSTNLMHKK
jgi:hypothetical protein